MRSLLLRVLQVQKQMESLQKAENERRKLLIETLVGGGPSGSGLFPPTKAAQQRKDVLTVSALLSTLPTPPALSPSLCTFPRRFTLLSPRSCLRVRASTIPALLYLDL